MLRALFIFSSLLYFSNTTATTVMPVALERMAQVAESIFYGRVISNEVRLDEVSQRVATFTTFEVIDAIKGVNNDTFIVKQFGGQLPGSTLVYRIRGIPRFTENEEYVVFLPTASRLGFASPIGLSQGSYNVTTGSGGKTVRHARSINLSSDAAARTALSPDATAEQSGNTPLTEFLQTVRTLSGN